MGEPLAALNTLNEKYTDFINESRKFVDTADITKADAKRDALFMAIYSAVEHLAQLEGETDTSLGRRARVVQAYPPSRKRAARFACREAIRLPDERSEEPCEARPQGVERWLQGCDGRYGSRGVERGRKSWRMRWLWHR